MEGGRTLNASAGPPGDPAGIPAAQAAGIPAALLALQARLHAFAVDDPALEHIDLLNEVAWESAAAVPDRALDWATRAAALARSRSYARGELEAARTQAYIELIRTNLKNGLDLATRALLGFRAIEHTQGEATALDILSNAHFFLGSYERALDFAYRGLELCARLGFDRGVAWAHHNLGNIYRVLGEYDRANTSYQTALQKFRQIPHPPGESRTCAQLGTLHREQQNYAESLAWFEQSLEISRVISMPLGQAYALMEMGATSVEMRRDTEAREQLEECLRVVRLHLGNRNMEAEALLHLGRIHIRQGQVDLAERDWRHALSLIADDDIKPTALRIHGALADLYENAGDLRRALDHTRTQHTLREAIFGDASALKLRQLEIRHQVESAERESELHRLRYEEKALAEARIAATLRELSRDLDLARRVQESALSNAATDSEELEVAIHFEPMIQVGGDIYDVHRRGPGRWRLLLADATGHGVQAALTTMLIKNEYDRFRDLDAPPQEILTRFNASIIALRSRLRLYFTCVLADLEFNAGGQSARLSLSFGGHPPQLLVSPGTVREVYAPGPVLGAFSEARYQVHTLQMSAGDSLLLFTDGLDETFDSRMHWWGTERLQECARRLSAQDPTGLVSGLVAEARVFQGDAPNRDDRTVLAVRLR